MLPGTMRAIVLRDYDGTADSLAISEIPVPRPGLAPDKDAAAKDRQAEKHRKTLPSPPNTAGSYNVYQIVENKTTETVSRQITREHFINRPGQIFLSSVIEKACKYYNTSVEC